MPLPFIIAGAAILAGGYGVKKGFDAKEDFEIAGDINKRAKKKYKKSEKKLEKARNKAQKSMESLGETKFNIYENSLIPFVEAFSKIKHVDFDSKNKVQKSLPKLTKDELQEMEESTLQLKEVIGGGVTALGSGGLAGLAAYGGVGMVGAASTGTAISGLSGVAATNATLAWLGGGSLATGGLGMAGGTMVLGGIVAGPVLAVGGMMLASKAEAAIEDAHSNSDTIDIAVEEMKTAKVTTEGIQLRFDEINEILNKLNERFEPLLISLTKLVSQNQDYREYSKENQNGVFICASLAKTLKNIMEAPLITKKGKLTNKSQKAIDLGGSTLKQLSA